MMILERILAMNQSTNNIWNTYYDDKNYFQVSNEINPSIAVTHNNLFIFKCNFQELDDRCIKITSTLMHLLHSDCNFNNILSVNRGSIIFIEKTNTNVVQRRFSAYNCCSEAFGSVAYTISDQSTTLSYAEESSITQCGKDNVDYIFHNKNGKVKFYYINFSKNCYNSKGFSITTQNFENIAFSTIAENNASKIASLYFDDCNNCIMQFCNVFKNFQDDTEFGKFYVIQTTLNIYNSSFINDFGKGRLFYAGYQAIINIYYSYLEDFSFSGNVTTYDNTQYMTVSLNYSDFYPSKDAKTHHQTHVIQVYNPRLRNYRK